MGIYLKSVYFGAISVYVLIKRIGYLLIYDLQISQKFKIDKIFIIRLKNIEGYAASLDIKGKGDLLCPCDLGFQIDIRADRKVRMLKGHIRLIRRRSAEALGAF